jgi:hypothetical protein
MWKETNWIWISWLFLRCTSPAGQAHCGYQKVAPLMASEKVAEETQSFALFHALPGLLQYIRRSPWEASCLPPLRPGDRLTRVLGCGTRPPLTPRVILSTFSPPLEDSVQLQHPMTCVCAWGDGHHDGSTESVCPPPVAVLPHSPLPVLIFSKLFVKRHFPNRGDKQAFLLPLCHSPPINIGYSSMTWSWFFGAAEPFQRQRINHAKGADRAHRSLSKIVTEILE